MYDWKEKIDSQVSGTYVVPLYPKTGTPVTIRLQIAKEVRNVLLFIDFDGETERFTCENHGTMAETIVPMKGKEAFYYFSLQAEHRCWYFSKLGLTEALPSQRDFFCLKADLQPAAWVAEATCYQIFPDRFRDGNPALDPKDNAYTFDGAQVRHKSFSEAPLPFDKARCLDFYGGDLQGIIDSIPYFKELDITCLYLNPIGDSRTTHRYDCCDFFHVDPKLGGDEMFEKLVKELHKNGIRIIIDISINHTGTENLWFKKALEDKSCEEASFYYFDENGKPSYWEGVPTLPQLNYGSEKLRQLIYKDKDSVLRKFLKEPYCQDGWRFDVANVVGRHGSDQFCKEIWQEVHKAIKKENPQAYMVGECWVDATAYLQGNMWDATMNYVGCSRPLRRWMGEIDRFQLEGWGTDPGSTIPYSGTDLRTALQSQLESLPTQMCFLQMNLFDSHDTPRVHTDTETMDKKLYEGIVMLTYLLPGMPSIYYGDEIQLAGDVHSVEAWRYPMEWDRSKWDMDIHHLYCVLGKLRRDWAEVLGNGSFAFLAADSKTMVFARYTTNQALILILNRGKARSFSFRTCQLNGKKTAVLMGNGSAEAVPDAILCHLEKRESLLLALT